MPSRPRKARKPPPDNAKNPAVTRIPRASELAGTAALDTSGFVPIASETPESDPVSTYHYRHKTLAGPVVTMTTLPRSLVSLVVRHPNQPERKLGVTCRAHDAGAVALALVKGF